MNNTIELTWAQPDERPEGREDSCWYTYQTENDPVVYVTKGDRTIEVCADGEMRVLVYHDPKNPSAGQDIVRYAEDWAEHNINNDADVFEASESDRIEWGANSWFDLYAIHNDRVFHLDAVCHTLSDAIEQATGLLDEEEMWADIYNGKEVN